jgi:hypothetical protein
MTDPLFVDFISCYISMILILKITTLYNDDVWDLKLIL